MKEKDLCRHHGCCCWCAAKRRNSWKKFLADWAKSTDGRTDFACVSACHKMLPAAAGCWMLHGPTRRGERGDPTAEKQNQSLLKKLTHPSPRYHLSFCSHIHLSLEIRAQYEYHVELSSNRNKSHEEQSLQQLKEETLLQRSYSYSHLNQLSVFAYDYSSFWFTESSSTTTRE